MTNGLYKLVRGFKNWIHPNRKGFMPLGSGYTQSKSGTVAVVLPTPTRQRVFFGPPGTKFEDMTEITGCVSFDGFQVDDESAPAPKRTGRNLAIVDEADGVRERMDELIERLDRRRGLAREHEKLPQRSELEKAHPELLGESPLAKRITAGIEAALKSKHGFINSRDPEDIARESRRREIRAQVEAARTADRLFAKASTPEHAQKQEPVTEDTLDGAAVRAKVCGIEVVGYLVKRTGASHGIRVARITDVPKGVRIEHIPYSFFHADEYAVADGNSHAIVITGYTYLPDEGSMHLWDPSR